MQTRSSSKFVGEPSTNPTSTIPKRRNRRRSKQRVEPFSHVETPVVTMADQLIMEYLVNITKRRAFWSLNENILTINDSDNQYAVSIKEDMALDKWDYWVDNEMIIKRSIQRISLTGFLARSVGSSNTDALGSPYNLVLITGMSQSRQHNKSESSPTAVLFDLDIGRISIRHSEMLKSTTLNVLARSQG
ncbi:hypothetical protein Tco_0535486 [Tanacetum coccineum]